MMKKNPLPALRLLLVVLLATFLSPDFGWQMVASHDTLAHASVNAPAGDSDHHHENDGHHQDHDDAAHGQIGHLLSHLPVFMHEDAPVFTPAAVRIAYPAHHKILVHADTDPPFKPPRNSLFA